MRRRDQDLQLAGLAVDETIDSILDSVALNNLEQFLRAAPRELGVVVPDPLYVNMAKYHFAHGYHVAVRNVQDIAGGALVTGPGAEDLATDVTARYYERFYAGRAGVGGKERLQALSLVRDLVASEFATYQEVLAVHAEGSLEAEKLMLFRSYDAKPALDLVRRLAGLT